MITTEGTSTVTSGTGEVIYSHKVTKSIIEDLSCRIHKPVSGTVQTTYRTDVVSVDFGDGTCSNTRATITLNGEVVTAKVE